MGLKPCLHLDNDGHRTGTLGLQGPYSCETQDPHACMAPSVGAGIDALHASAENFERDWQDAAEEAASAEKKGSAQDSEPESKAL